MNVVAVDFFREIMDSTHVDICTKNPDDYFELCNSSLGSTKLRNNSFNLKVGENVQVITISDQEPFQVYTAGMARFVCLNNRNAVKLGYVTTCTLQYVTVEDLVTLPPWDITFTGPEWANRKLAFEFRATDKIVSVHSCHYCGNKSGRMDLRGNCISCGAQL